MHDRHIGVLNSVQAEARGRAQELVLHFYLAYNRGSLAGHHSRFWGLSCLYLPSHNVNTRIPDVCDPTSVVPESLAHGTLSLFHEDELTGSIATYMEASGSRKRASAEHSDSPACPQNNESRTPMDP